VPSDVVHIVDDDAGVRQALTMIVESAGHTVRAHASAEEFLGALASTPAGCVVTDVRMPGMSGMDLLQTLRRRVAHVPVVVITGHGDVAMAVEALKSGAEHVIQRPLDGS
jgi:two-component system response regulator FixJ